jgi:hypothetical protein
MTRMGDARCKLRIHTFFVCPRVGVRPLNKFLVYPGQHPNGRVRETVSQGLWTSRLHRKVSSALCLKCVEERQTFPFARCIWRDEVFDILYWIFPEYDRAGTVRG